MSLLNDRGGQPLQDLSLQKGNSSQLLARFKGFVKKHGLFSKKSSILAAVSGGPDSICLLNLLVLLSHPWALSVSVAHFDHCLRGEESRRDCEFVKAICAANSIPFFTEKAAIGTMAKEKGLCIQDMARKARYSFLERITSQHGFDLIVTAHTMDDQAEEIIFRLCRGAGPGGLSGIRLKRTDRIARPLLFARKEEILQYLYANSIPFVTDSSNLNTKYTRNKIRAHVLPVIQQKINPAAVKAIFRAGRILSEEDEAMNFMTRKALSECRCSIDSLPGEVLDTYRLRSHPAAIRKRIYRKILVNMGQSPGSLRYDHLEKIDEIVMHGRPSSWYCLPHGCMVVRNYDRLYFSSDRNLPGKTIQKTDRKESQAIIVERPGVFMLPKDAGMVEIREDACPDFKNPPSRTFPRPLWMPASQAFPMEITYRMKGDRFQPIGMDHTVKLKKFLINRNIPRQLRDILPLLRKNSKIVAVIGVEISQYAKICDHDSKCLLVSWMPGPRAALFMPPA